jgi:predicted RNase H-like HicB family nuclease
MTEPVAKPLLVTEFEDRAQEEMLDNLGAISYFYKRFDKWRKLMKDKKAVLVSFVIERNDDGYLVSVPSIQGAFAEGDSIEEAIFNCVDVLKMIFDYRRERGEATGFHAVKLTANTRMTVALPVGIG